MISTLEDVAYGTQELMCRSGVRGGVRRISRKREDGGRLNG